MTTLTTPEVNLSENSEKETYLQLVYISASSVEFTQQDLKQLLAKARENNQRIGVSGMLIYDQGSFFQVLEGPEESVYKVYDLIGGDPRHDNVQLLMKNIVEDRSFEDWSMGFVNTEKEPLCRLPGFSDFF